MTDSDYTLIERLEALETKVSFQDVTIDELNQMVIILQRETSKLKEQLQVISEKLKAAQLSDIANQSDETPPPHY